MEKISVSVSHSKITFHGMGTTAISTMEEEIQEIAFAAILTPFTMRRDHYIWITKVQNSMKKVVADVEKQKTVLT